MSPPSLLSRPLSPPWRPLLRTLSLNPATTRGSSPAPTKRMVLPYARRVLYLKVSARVMVTALLSLVPSTTSSSTPARTRRSRSPGLPMSRAENQMTKGRCLSPRRRERSTPRALSTTTSTSTPAPSTTTTTSTECLRFDMPW
ncbi:hypothetical protein C8Q72DRAFT_955627 [Fomitopsis betulina]|nr:hypothetical protein C8Q72DRAFT_955627 [Fomitopsis betulina]